MKSLAEKVLPDKLKKELQRVLKENNHHRAVSGKGVCAAHTQYDRAVIISMALAQLWQMGRRLPSLKSLGNRHIYLLMKRWAEEGITVRVLHTRLSYLRTFARWIGKDGMVQDIRDYLPGRDLTRRAAARKNLSWEANGVDAEEVIAHARELDERLALILSIERAFGLRMKEAIEMRPAYCLAESGKCLEIYEGTKGGRLRRVDIDSDYKREVLEWARRLAAKSREGRVRWPGKTWKQARRRYYYLLEKLGVTQASLGVTSHGLRHGYAQAKYEDLTGLPPPIAGVDPKQVDPDAHRDASIQVSRDLGHGRTQVTASYYGSHGHALRGNRAVPKKE
ncbi:MAG: hypothetical protein DPW12_15370 [Rhodocyclaceae bacterium]|nr:hypothetical protein [Bacteroidia bacterium]MCQ3925517.1 hypothetical protein [Rhodocyclaceae bacterium]